MLTLAHILFGAALSVRCNVFALAAATIASITFDVWLGAVAGDAYGTIIVFAGLNVIALQVTYLVCGVVVSILSNRLDDPSAAVPRAAGRSSPEKPFYEPGRSKRGTHHRRASKRAIN